MESSFMFLIFLASFTNIVGKWPYAHSKTSPHIAVCTPAFLGNFIKGPNILEEELFGKLETLVLDEVRTYGKLFARQFSLQKLMVMWCPMSC
jgi:hypothetical protein